ncbi:MAG: recombinase [Tissierellia bacterium]|nr:recombinase [Tissierellia bacterium]
MIYEEYEELYKLQQKKNEEYLTIFERDLMKSGLAQKTIKKHLNNVYFYINTFLLKEEPLDMEDGCGYKIDDFLGDFFIRKCMWSTPGSIKTTASSIKKFYKSMNEHGYISNDEYKNLCDIIKNNMEIWQLDCDTFNNYY